MKNEWAEAAGQKMDWPGAGMYSLTLLAVMNSFRLLSDLSGVIVMAAGVLCLAGIFASLARGKLHQRQT